MLREFVLHVVIIPVISPLLSILGVLIRCVPFRIFEFLEFIIFFNTVRVDEKIV
jgi:hypothetical protein